MLCRCGGSKSYDVAASDLVCGSCGLCQYTSDPLYAPANEVRHWLDNPVEMHWSGYHPKYHLRERVRNATITDLPPRIFEVYEMELRRATSLLPGLHEHYEDPLKGRLITCEILRSLEKRDDFDPEIKALLRTPTLKERWTAFWSRRNKDSRVCPLEQTDFEHMEFMETVHEGLVSAFQALKGDVWPDKRKNLPFLPYCMGVALLRRYGWEKFKDLVAWWLPPRTTSTLRRCRKFLDLATKRGWILQPKGPFDVDYPKEVFLRLKEAKTLARRVRQVLTKTPLPRSLRERE